MNTIYIEFIFCALIFLTSFCCETSRFCGINIVRIKIYFLLHFRVIYILLNIILSIGLSFFWSSLFTAEVAFASGTTQEDFVKKFAEIKDLDFIMENGLDDESKDIWKDIIQASGEGLLSTGMSIEEVGARLLVLEKLRVKNVDPFVYYTYYTYDVHHGSGFHDGAVDYFLRKLKAWEVRHKEIKSNLTNAFNEISQVEDNSKTFVQTNSTKTNLDRYNKRWDDVVSALVSTFKQNGVSEEIIGWNKEGLNFLRKNGVDPLQFITRVNVNNGVVTNFDDIMQIYVDEIVNKNKNVGVNNSDIIVNNEQLKDTKKVDKAINEVIVTKDMLTFLQDELSKYKEMEQLPREEEIQIVKEEPVVKDNVDAQSFVWNNIFSQIKEEGLTNENLVSANFNDLNVEAKNIRWKPLKCDATYISYDEDTAESVVVKREYSKFSRRALYLRKLEELELREYQQRVRMAKLVAFLFVCSFVINELHSKYN